MAPIKFYTLIAILLLFIPSTSSGKELYIKEVKPTDEIITNLDNKLRKDLNGVACAMVKVMLSAENVTFEGNVIGDVVFKSNHYIVYLPTGTKKIVINCPGFSSKHIDFVKYVSSSGLESKRVYYILFENMESNDRKTDMDSLRIDTRKKFFGNHIPSTAVKFVKEKADSLRFRFRDTESKLYGLMDLWGNIIVYPQFERCSDSNFNSYLNIVSPYIRCASNVTPGVLSVNDHYFYIDLNGDETIPEFMKTPEAVNKKAKEMDAIFLGKIGNLYKISDKSSLVGFLDESGNVIWPICFGIVWNQEGMSMVMTLENKWGIIDKNGQIIAPIEYEDIRRFDEKGNVYTAKKNGEWHCYSKGGKLKSFNSFKYADNFHSGLARVSNDDVNFGFIDYQGEYVIPPHIHKSSLTEWSGFVQNYYLSDHGLIDKQGKILDIEGAYMALDGIVLIRVNGKEGLKTTDNKTLLSPEFEDIEWYEMDERFEEQLKDYITAKRNGKWGAYSWDGKEIRSCQYDLVCSWPYFNEYIKFRIDNKWGFFDKRGRIVVAPLYTEIEADQILLRALYFFGT